LAACRNETEIKLQVLVKEVDISLLENQKYFDLYKYEVPVLSIGDKVLLKKNFDEQAMFSGIDDHLVETGKK